MKGRQLCCDWLCFSIVNSRIQTWRHRLLLVAAINIHELDIDTWEQPQNVNQALTGPNDHMMIML